MFKRSVLLRGRDYIDQLRLTVQLLDTLQQKDLKSISKAGARDLVKRWKYPGLDFATQFPNASPGGLDMLRKLLSFDPDERFSVQDALDHDYLANVRAEVKKGEPVCKAGKFDDSFEHDFPLETEMP